MLICTMCVYIGSWMWMSSAFKKVLSENNVAAVTLDNAAHVSLMTAAAALSAVALLIWHLLY